MWPSASITVRRIEQTVVVTVQGALDQIGAAGLCHILTDLMEGQGNLFVRVEFDLLAEASVLSVLAKLRPLAPEVGQLGDPSDAPFSAGWG